MFSTTLKTGWKRFFATGTRFDFYANIPSFSKTVDLQNPTHLQNLITFQKKTASPYIRIKEVNGFSHVLASGNSKFYVHLLSPREKDTFSQVLDNWPELGKRDFAAHFLRNRDRFFALCPAIPDVIVSLRFYLKKRELARARLGPYALQGFQGFQELGNGSELCQKEQDVRNRIALDLAWSLATRSKKAHFTRHLLLSGHEQDQEEADRVHCVASILRYFDPQKALTLNEETSLKRFLDSDLLYQHHETVGEHPHSHSPGPRNFTLCHQLCCLLLYVLRMTDMTFPFSLPCLSDFYFPFPNSPSAPQSHHHLPTFHNSESEINSSTMMQTVVRAVQRETKKQSLLPFLFEFRTVKSHCLKQIISGLPETNPESLWYTCYLPCLESDSEQAQLRQEERNFHAMKKTTSSSTTTTPPRRTTGQTREQCIAFSQYLETFADQLQYSNVICEVQNHLLFLYYLIYNEKIMPLKSSPVIVDSAH